VDDDIVGRPLRHAGFVSDVASTLAQLGGFARTRALRRRHTKRALRAAVANGQVVRLRHGRYAVPGFERDPGLALACHGTLSHLSAALQHGWKIKAVPEKAWVTIPRVRGQRSSVPEQVHLHHADLADDDVVFRRGARVTIPLRTVMDCARILPFDDALAVADSALRSGKVTAAQLRSAAATAKGPGSAQVRRIAEFADGRAANPFESVLRALALEEGLALQPQVMIAEPGMFAVVDLAEPDGPLVVEAEGFATHGTRTGLRRDCRRHTEFTIHGRASLRYAYEDVMFDQAWVRWTFRTLIATREGRPVEAPPTGVWAVA